MILFLTSSLDTNYKDEDGNRIVKEFTKENHLLDNLKKYIKNYNNLLMIASNENEYLINDEYFNCNVDSFNMTMPFKNYHLLDGRNINDAKELIDSSDAILLFGGHVPTQNAFFTKIHLKELIKNYEFVIIGVSAGSMNSSRIVYAEPEEEGEATDENYKLYIDGLGLTEINIIPHYNKYEESVLDGLRLHEDIRIPNSFKRAFLAYPDNTYVLIDKDITIYGEAYLFKDGIINKICDNNQTIKIDENYSIL